MSAWSAVTLSIVIFTTIIYLCLMVFNFTGLLLYHNLNGKQVVEDDPDLRLLEHENNKYLEAYENLAMFIIELMVYTIMFMLSILCAVGIRKQRCQFISPWLWMDAIIVIFNALHFYYPSSPVSDFKFIVDAILLCVQTITWFPVFTCYKKFSKSPSLKQSGFIRATRAKGQNRQTKASAARTGQFEASIAKIFRNQ